MTRFMNRMKTLTARVVLGSGLCLAASVARADATSTAQVVNVYCLVNDVRTNAAGLGDSLVVSVDGLSPQQQGFASKNKGKLILFLNAATLPGLCTYVGVAPNTGHAELRFRLQRTDATRQEWAAILGQPRQFSLPVHVTVGLEDGGKLPGDDDANIVYFIVIHERWFWACLIMSALLLVVVFLLATKTGALRDDGPAPPGDLPRPYSLARCQMAFWFVLVVPAFVFLWLMTGTYDTLTQSMLVLMGVSAGTAVFAHAQAAGNRDNASISSPVPVSEGFIKDALTDDVGISFHRFQMFVWTIVMGIIYVTEVWHNLAMPEFSGTTLGLMGISSGTYLGFMLTEFPHHRNKPLK